VEFLPDNGDNRREQERPWADDPAGTTHRPSRRRRHWPPSRAIEPSPSWPTPQGLVVV